MKTLKTKDFFLFEIIITALVSSLRFIWIPMLWVYGLKYFYSYSTWIDFSRQILTTKVDPRAVRANPQIRILLS